MSSSASSDMLAMPPSYSGGDIIVAGWVSSGRVCRWRGLMERSRGDSRGLDGLGLGAGDAIDEAGF